MNEHSKSTLVPLVQGVFATAEERNQGRNPALAQFDRLVGQAALLALRQHGREPLDREVAAAHEAGHAIVALAVGHTSRINRVIVKRVPPHEAHALDEVWLGRIYLPEDEHAQAMQAGQGGDAWAIVRNATFTLGGMAGEAAIGREHLASSMEDRMGAQLGCQLAAALERGAPNPFSVGPQVYEDWCEAHMKAIVDLSRSIFVACGVAAMQAIERNRRPFDRLRHKLMTHERLGWPEVEPLVEDLQLTPLGVAL